MPASGLLALLDDIAAIADDVATLSMMAAKKSSGIVTDDMAVTAEQAVGIRREREIPVVVAVAKGSLKNKFLILVPGALVLNAVAPWIISPILMAGGAFLSFEGAEKVLHKVMPHEDLDGEAKDDESAPDVSVEAFEAMRVQGAVRTDLILSGEIIVITLGQVAASPFVTQVGVLGVVSLAMTVGVYGIVAGLVKLDDAGEWMVKRGGSQASLGKLIVLGAPKLLHLIGIVGTVAMLMVGGHILIEGIPALHHFIQHTVETFPAALQTVSSLAADVLVGAVAGLAIVGVMATGIPAKLWGMVRRKPAS